MIQAIQLILALSFLVLIHELGHFTFAKIFHVRVEKFYLFFNPWISLVRFKKFDGKWHVKFFAKNGDEEWAKHPDQTEWGIGWLPFGGYCAIGGMVVVERRHHPVGGVVVETMLSVVDGGVNHHDAKAGDIKPDEPVDILGTLEKQGAEEERGDDEPQP